MMLTRREFIRGGIASTALAFWPSGCVWRFLEPGRIVVNDLHSQLNPTHVDQLISLESFSHLQKVLQLARTERKEISIAGGRHAMGGQQFGTDTILLDMTKMDQVILFDPQRGEIEVEAGIQWPELTDYLLQVQQGQHRQWGIIQKQTGADRLSIGGALSANVHGRGLRFKPFIGDVESFMLIDADGIPRKCSRRENSELFRLAIGGYGLLGIIVSVTLRLAPRKKVERVVEVIEVEDLI
ncbi:MAG: FAD-binding oxidoreductase, partial [Nitrospira sp.]|nr:FAD-binding oxidoreductase [Nitrospira sp.]